MTSGRCSGLCGWIGGAEADLDRAPALDRPPRRQLHPVAADRHDVVRARDVDRHQRQVVLGGEHRRAGAQLADAAVARARALGEHHEAPARLEQLVDVAGAVVVEAAAVARHRHGAEEQRHGPAEPALGVEVVGRGGHRRAGAGSGRGSARRIDRRVHVARVVGDEQDRRARAPRSARGRAPCGACRGPSAGPSTPISTASRTARAGGLRDHPASRSSRSLTRSSPG